MKLPELTYEDVNKAINYDPDTGIFTWKLDASRNVKANSVAGTFKSCRHRSTGQVKSYLYIRYKDREMVASRVAWLLYYRQWPENDRSVMFLDGDTKNLKINNLKLSDVTIKIINKDGRVTRKISRDKQRHYSLKRYYGMSLAEYSERFRQQDGKCAICRKPETDKDRHGNIRVLAVDHCHTTGAVRELLCYACNSMLGQAKDDKETLSAAIAYLKKHEEADNLGTSVTSTGQADAAQTT